MASSCRLLSAAVLLAVLAAAAAAAAASAPGYCVPSQAIPSRPLPTCRWYVSSRTCGLAIVPYPLLPVMKERCCRELEAVAPECRCKALRVMIDDMSVYPTGGGGAQQPEMMTEQERCWHAQAEFAATVVTDQECGLRTIHGGNFCYALGAE